MKKIKYDFIINLYQKNLYQMILMIYKIYNITKDDFIIIIVSLKYYKFKHID